MLIEAILLRSIKRKNSSKRGDLADELPGFQDFVAPLNQIKDSTCAAPKNPKKSGGSQNDERNPQNLDPPAPSQSKKRYDYELSTDGYCFFLGVLSPLYPIAICCDGDTKGPGGFTAIVRGCTPCKFLNIRGLQMIAQ